MEIICKKKCFDDLFFFFVFGFTGVATAKKSPKLVNIYRLSFSSVVHRVSNFIVAASVFSCLPSCPSLVCLMELVLVL